MMRTTIAAGLACFCLNQPVIAADTAPSFLFLQEASGASFDGSTLTLTDPKQTVTAFADRPNRIVADTDLERFVKGWTKGADSFEADPPNAALIAEGLAPVIVELGELSENEGSLQYAVTVLSGDLPETMDGITLVIDDNESTCTWVGC